MLYQLSYARTQDTIADLSLSEAREMKTHFHFRASDRNIPNISRFRIFQDSERAKLIFIISVEALPPSACFARAKHRRLPLAPDEKQSSLLFIQLTPRALSLARPY